jgi:uncharacterized protein YndB with AHSA1/START domain
VTAGLEAVDLSFLDTAPFRFAFSADVAAPPAEVFAAVSADPATWRWFPGFRRGGYEGPPPWGVGTRRHITIGPGTYRETILAWDEPTRWVYRVDETSVPMARALVEDWSFRPSSLGNVTTVVWTFAIRPARLFRAALPIAPVVMRRLFEKAMRQLGDHLARH